MPLTKTPGVKELLAVFALVGAIFAGIQGVKVIAGDVSSEQIDKHTIVAEEKHAVEYEGLRREQAIMQTDVAVTSERVRVMGEDITEIKEMIRDQE